MSASTAARSHRHDVHDVASTSTSGSYGVGDLGSALRAADATDRPTLQAPERGDCGTDRPTPRSNPGATRLEANPATRSKTSAIPFFLSRSTHPPSINHLGGNFASPRMTHPPSHPPFRAQHAQTHPPTSRPTHTVGQYTHRSTHPHSRLYGCVTVLCNGCVTVVSGCVTVVYGCICRCACMLWS